MAFTPDAEKAIQLSYNDTDVSLNVTDVGTASGDTMDNKLDANKIWQKVFDPDTLTIRVAGVV